MEKLSNQERLRPWMGIIYFAVVIAIFCTLGKMLYREMGLIGTVIYEVIFAGLGILLCVIRKVDLKEVFPIHKPRFKDLAGSFLLVLGGSGASSLCNALMSLVAPKFLTELALDNTTLLTSGTPLQTILIVSITPAICEEAMYRGVIQSSFRSMKKDWLIALITGLLFSINHLSIPKLLPILIVGWLISYVMAKKNNILLTMLMHFVLNFRSIVPATLLSKFVDLSESADLLSTVDTKQTVGSLLITGFSAPILIALGLFLINRELGSKKLFISTGVLSGVMLITGLGLLMSSFLKPMIFSETGTINATPGYTYTYEFDTRESDHHTIQVTAINEDKNGRYYAKLTDDNGEVYLNEELSDILSSKTMTTQVDLPEGHYHLEFRCDDNNAAQESIYIQVTVR